jgi:hypothetical protein
VIQALSKRLGGVFVVAVLLASAGPSAVLGTALIVHGADRVSHPSTACAAAEGTNCTSVDGLVDGAGALVFGLLFAGGGYIALGMTAYDAFRERRVHRVRATLSSGVG